MKWKLHCTWSLKWFCLSANVSYLPQSHWSITFKCIPCLNSEFIACPGKFDEEKQNLTHWTFNEDCLCGKIFSRKISRLRYFLKPPPVQTVFPHPLAPPSAYTDALFWFTHFNIFINTFIFLTIYFFFSVHKLTILKGPPRWSIFNAIFSVFHFVLVDTLLLKW